MDAVSIRLDGQQLCKMYSTGFLTEGNHSSSSCSFLRILRHVFGLFSGSHSSGDSTCAGWGKLPLCRCFVGIAEVGRVETTSQAYPTGRFEHEENSCRRAFVPVLSDSLPHARPHFLCLGGRGWKSVGSG